MTGSIQVRDLKKGRKYYCIWRVNGKQKWKAFDKRKEAERYLATVVKATHDGIYQDVQPLAMVAVFNRWLDGSLMLRVKQGLLKPSTAKSYRSMLDSHLRPAFGEYRSDRLTHAVVNDWAAQMANAIAEGNITPKFYNNLLNLLHAILAWARHPAQGYLAHDPLIGMRRLPKPRIEREFLEPREIQALLEAATPPDDTILHVAIYTGLRRGELFALQWGDVDWGTGRDGGRIWVKRSLYQGKITTPKTESSIRVVDVSQRTLDELAVHREMSPPRHGGFILHTLKGTPIDPDSWYKRRFLPILQRAGLRQVGLHALRHTYASLLINQGESIKYVSKQLGHASIQITADLDGHLFRETSVSAMRRLQESMMRGGFPSNSHLTEHAKTQ
jgi:integrase